METKFNFKSQICTTREQSERLLALGLKKETADMVYRSFGYIIDEFGNTERRFKKPTMVDKEWECKYDIPAWSLHRLIELIWEDGEHDMSLETHRPFEDCIERIEYMINQSHCFNKEYLNGVGQETD